MKTVLFFPGGLVRTPFFSTSPAILYTAEAYRFLGPTLFLPPGELRGTFPPFFFSPLPPDQGNGGPLQGFSFLLGADIFFNLEQETELTPPFFAFPPFPARPPFPFLPPQSRVAPCPAL